MTYKTNFLLPFLLLQSVLSTERFSYFCAMQYLSRILFSVCLLTCFQFSFAQSETGKSYTFSQIGWSFTLPGGFTPMDSATAEAASQRGTKAIEDANGITADMSKTKTLISATKNSYNYFNVTITPYDVAKDGDFTTVSNGVKGVVYTTFAGQMPDAVIDSSTTIVSIDGLSFDKFRVTVTMQGKAIFNMFLLSKLYKGFDLGIAYLYVDEDTKQEIEALLSNSKFTK